MAKKQFASSFNDIFAPSIEQPNVANDIPSNTKVEESGTEIQRTTILLNRETYETIKAIAHWERTQIKVLIDNALETIIGSYSAEQIESMKGELANSKSKR